MKKYRKLYYSLILSIAVIAGTITASTFKVQADSVSLLPNLTSTAYNSDNIFTTAGYKGQCTWFTYGRVLEKLGIKLPSEFYGNAITWYDRNATDKVYNYGVEPKANSIIVWSGGSVGNGHVGFVEKVEGDLVYFNEANFSVKGNYEGKLEVLSKTAIQNRGNCFVKGYIYVTEKCATTLYGHVNLSNATSTLCVRTGAGTTFGVIGNLPNNTNVTILEKNGTWYKIQYANSIGYVSASYVTLISASSVVQLSKLGTVKLLYPTSTLNVRAGANASAAVINTLKNGTTITIFEQDGDFYKIACGNISGYASVSYIVKQ